MSEQLDASEWIEIGHVAVRTRSIVVAARVAAQVERTRQSGKIVDGLEFVEFMCLARFREALRS